MSTTKTLPEATATCLARDLASGDVILPPAREISLWMRRGLAEGRLTEDSFRITVASVERANPDKRGEWLKVKGADRGGFRWTIKVRPETPWPVLQRGEG